MTRPILTSVYLSDQAPASRTKLAEMAFIFAPTRTNMGDENAN